MADGLSYCCVCTPPACPGSSLVGNSASQSHFPLARAGTPRQNPASAMIIRELNHVAIHVTDVRRSSEFYQLVLKLEAIPRPAFSFPGAWFRLGAHQELHLIGHHGAAFSPANRNNHFALRVDDLDAWERHLKSVGAAFAPKKQRPDGASQVFVSDPDGHAIELFTPAS